MSNRPHRNVLGLALAALLAGVVSVCASIPKSAVEVFPNSTNSRLTTASTEGETGRQASGAALLPHSGAGLSCAQVQDGSDGLAWLGRNRVDRGGVTPAPELHATAPKRFNIIDASDSRAIVNNSGVSAEIGDTVLSFDRARGVVTERVVLETYTNIATYMVDVVAGGEVISATPEHRFWIADANVWIEARDVRSGMQLRLAADRLVVVDEVRNVRLATPRKTYNLNVAVDHAYFVGEGRILVHNDCTAKPDKAAPAAAKRSLTFSKTPKASELRDWARQQGYVKKVGDGPETWVDPKTGEWRLKIKQPSTRPGLDSDSAKPRCSARTAEGTYYDPATGRSGTRGELGHLDLDIGD